jgi:serine/threonine-protein kinase
MARAPLRIDKYHVVRRLGSGGMGTVYLARDAGLGREVAIKVLRGPVFDTDDELLARFLQEARATAKLRHTNIVTVYEVGQHDQQPFIVMEYVAGHSLAALIHERRPLPLATKLHYLEQICAGLHFAHRAGIVHRDIKPANVMVDPEGMVRILDFGIARLEDSRMTRDGDMMGTVNYMSPEQMLGRRVDHRSDIFAVGAVAYELIAYRQAFPGTMSDGLLERLPHDPPVPLSSLCPEIDSGIEALINRTLEKTPDARFADLAGVHAAVTACRRRILGERGPTYEVPPAPPLADFAVTLHRPRPRADHDEIQSELEEAERCLQAGDPTSALNLAERVIQKVPSSVEAHALLVRAHGALALAGAVADAPLRPPDAPVPSREVEPIRTWVFAAAGAGVIAAALTTAGVLGLFAPREPTPVEPPSAAEPTTSASAPATSDALPTDRGPEHAPADEALKSPPVMDVETRAAAAATANGPRDRGDAAGREGPAATPAPQEHASARQTDSMPARNEPVRSPEFVPPPSASVIPAPSRDLPPDPLPPPAVVETPEAMTQPAEPPPSATPVVSVLERERPGILAALAQYSAAYRNRSVEAMEAVFPALPRERRQAYERAFKDRRGCPALDVRFGAAEIFLGADGQQANVTVVATYVCKPATAQDDPQVPQGDVFQLRKNGDRWQIIGMGALQ